VTALGFGSDEVSGLGLVTALGSKIGFRIEGLVTALGLALRVEGSGLGPCDCTGGAPDHFRMPDAACILAALAEMSARCGTVWCQFAFG
jgi:hypothetical protein